MAARPARPTGGESAQRTINLALQGGGAHGAFSWGVLDRLLEDERIAIEGISATSAGSMNAVACASGMATGGRDGARAVLERFWLAVAAAGAASPLQPNWLDKLMGNHTLEASPQFFFFDMLTRLFSPYEFNPLNLNPLRDVLETVVDFAALRDAPMPIKLFISATNVRTGKIKVFDRTELSADAVLASACLPFMFQAVEIGGEHYWDGGYMGNPAIYPLIYHCESADVVIVHINPLERPEVPKTARDILNRMNEISFNSSLMREMRAIQFVTDLLDQGKVSGKQLKRMHLHSVVADDVMGRLGVNSKMNAERGFLLELRDAGRRHAGQWLEQNFASLGVGSTIDIRRQYL